MSIENQDYLSKRKAAAQSYKPKKVETLFIAEAPPCKEDWYFYYEDVRKQDSLWIELTKAIYKTDFGETRFERTRKDYWLKRFCDDGYFLIDAVETPTVSPSIIQDNAPKLIKRIKEIDPEGIVLIKKSVYENLYQRLNREGFLVMNKMIPFPGSGQQVKFRSAMSEALYIIKAAAED